LDASGSKVGATKKRKRVEEPIGASNRGGQGHGREVASAAMRVVVSKVPVLRVEPTPDL
jgi:hypothetical protein